MTTQPIRLVSAAVFATVACLALASCGGGQPSQQPAAPASAAPASAVAPSEPASVPPSTDTAQVAQPAAKPAAARPASEAVHKPTPTPTPQAKPEPPPPPKPEPVIKTVASGTDLNVEFIDGASSKTSQVGSVVRARVTTAVIVDGLTVVPEGAIVQGTVTEAIPLKKIGGTASLGLRFDTLELGNGTTSPIAAGLHEQGKSETGKDAGTIAGATAGGALLGRLLSKHDKTKGTLIGAAVGAAAGTGAAAATKGQEVELPPGTRVALHLEAPMSITVQP